MPTARNYDPTVTGKTQKPSMWDYVEVLRDVRVVVMIFRALSALPPMVCTGLSRSLRCEMRRRTECPHHRKAHRRRMARHAILNFFQHVCAAERLEQF